MYSSAIWKSIIPFCLFFCLFLLPCKAGTFTPKNTVIELLSDRYVTMSYGQKLIKVNWCLFPSVPVKKKSFYVTASHTNKHATKFFEVEEHTQCKYGYPGSPKDLKEARKRYITNVDITQAQFYAKKMPKDRAQIRCHKGLVIQQLWLGDRYTFPWQAVTRCRDSHGFCTGKRIQGNITRELIYNGGIDRISIFNETSCRRH